MRKFFSFLAVLLLFAVNISAYEISESNVVDVEWRVSEDGRFMFSVTIVHDDDNEEGYADYWVVENTEGIELGKRVLTHRHNNEPFARTEYVAIPENVSIVVVRGHDMDHGFGGQMAIADLTTKEVEFLDQGENRTEYEPILNVIPELLEEAQEEIAEIDEEIEPIPELYEEVTTTTIKKELPASQKNILYAVLGVILLIILFDKHESHHE